MAFASRPYRLLLAAAAAGMAVAVGQSDASAGVSYSYVAESNAVTVNTSATRSVLLYLRETVDGGSSSILASEQGLFNAGVRVTSSGGSTTTTNTTIAAASPLVANPAFNGATDVPTPTATLARLIEGKASPDAPGVLSTDLGGGVRQLFLGTLNLRGADTIGQTTTFTLSAYRPYVQGGAKPDVLITATNGYDLDVPNNGGSAVSYAAATATTFTVTTVPEPTGFALLAVAAGGLLARRRRAAVAG